jgi:hypothetical protein
MVKHLAAEVLREEATVSMHREAMGDTLSRTIHKAPVVTSLDAVLSRLQLLIEWIVQRLLLRRVHLSAPLWMT